MNKFGTIYKGYRNPMAKLNKRIVKEIREEYAAGGISHAALAKKYNISSSNVGRIIRHEIWTEC